MYDVPVPPTPDEDVDLRLDGAARQRVASGLWKAWRNDGVGAAVVAGFSGVGKSERVVRPLMARAVRAGIVAVRIDVPPEPIEMDQELMSELVGELRLGSHSDLADATELASSFAASVRGLLADGVLVVVDEFQRLLTKDNRPIDPLATQLDKLARRPFDGGCLWLVTNRSLDAVWTEAFEVAQLGAPPDEDAVRIVLGNITADQNEARFPPARRIEVVRRLGTNPRVLRLLGYLLNTHDLDELLGPPGELPPSMPFAPVLVEDIERSLLSKAEAGLSASALRLLIDLSVLRGWADWKLVEAISGRGGDAKGLVDELRARYLLEVRQGRRYRLNPVVRETHGARLHDDDRQAWDTANRNAGEWFASQLVAAAKSGAREDRLTVAIAGAKFHLQEARATDVLANALRSASEYLERRYGWTARRPANAAERDARISLLESYLTLSGTSATRYQLARLLKERAGQTDRERALCFAEQATHGQDFSDPWLLRIQLAHEVHGADAAIEIALVAVEHVMPAKNLFAVYQLSGSLMCWQGRPAQAVETLLTGAERSHGNEERLVQEALLIAAAESGNDLLNVVTTRTEWERFEPQRSLRDVLVCERDGRWRDGAETARTGRSAYPAFLPLALHEALCWLGAGDPKRAEATLDSFPVRAEQGTAASWLFACIALEASELPTASQFLALYLCTPAPAWAAPALRARLLHAWDHPQPSMGPQPAVTFPVLPETLTGLGVTSRRPQYGSPVLGHPSAHDASPGDRRLKVLSIATEWESAKGGLSTLNRDLCSALAAAGADVTCVVLAPTEAERSSATMSGVTLVSATPTPGASELMLLARRPNLGANGVPDIVIGHGRVTGPAAQALCEDHFPSAKRLHVVHMTPDEIEWDKLDREDDAGVRAEVRTEVEIALGRAAHRVIAIGPRLHERCLSDFAAYDDVLTPLRLDPGFDAVNTTPRIPPPGRPWRVLLFGRAEDDRLKGLDLAAEAVGRAVQARGPSVATVELWVLGAPDNGSSELRRKLTDWASAPSLSIVVRPFSTDSERIDAALRRASLVLMPSRVEGFGLTGLEAIVAGTPVLVSGSSGLGALLRESLDTDDVERCVVPVDATDVENAARWSNAVQAVLLDREAAFARASDRRRTLAESKPWSAAVRNLLDELGFARR